MSEKDFDSWNNQKKRLDRHVRSYSLFFHEREVWWCSLGLNVGVEADGKNEYFERPVLIIRKFNGEMLWVLPMTSKQKIGIYYMKISHDQRDSWVCLFQIRTVSTKRLLRKIGMISESEFKQVSRKIIDFLTIGPRMITGSSEA